MSCIRNKTRTACPIKLLGFTFNLGLALVLLSLHLTHMAIAQHTFPATHHVILVVLLMLVIQRLWMEDVQTIWQQPEAQSNVGNLAVVHGMSHNCSCWHSLVGWPKLCLIRILCRCCGSWTSSLTSSSYLRERHSF